MRKIGIYLLCLLTLFTVTIERENFNLIYTFSIKKPVDASGFSNFSFTLQFKSDKLCEWVFKSFSQNKSHLHGFPYSFRIFLSFG